MVDAGITPLDECIQKFDELKMKKTYKYIIYSIKDKKNVVVETLGKSNAEYAEFVKILPKDQPRFAVFDYITHTQDVPPREISKICYFYWSPDNCKMQDKFCYASTNESFKKKLIGIQKTFDVHDYGDLDADEISKDCLK